MSTYTPYIKQPPQKAAVPERAMYYWYDERRSLESLRMMAHVDQTLRAHPTLNHISVLPEPRWVDFLRDAA